MRPTWSRVLVPMMAWQHQCVLSYCNSVNIPQQTVWVFHKALEKFHGRRRMLKLAGKPVLGRASKREKQMSGSNNHRYFFTLASFSQIQEKPLHYHHNVCILSFMGEIWYTPSLVFQFKPSPCLTRSLLNTSQRPVWKASAGFPAPGIFGSGYAPRLAADRFGALWGPKVQRRWVVGLAPKQRYQDSYCLWNQPQLHIPTSDCEGLSKQGSGGEMLKLDPFGLAKWKVDGVVWGVKDWRGPQTLAPTKTTHIRVRVKFPQHPNHFVFARFKIFNRSIYGLHTIKCFSTYGNSSHVL